MVFSSLLIMCIPIPWLKRWCNKKAMLITFRLLARALSAVITYHNKEYAPRSSGICVANHTTPVDIVMVATNNIFALVRP
jgi:glycerol-3-phosphate O-acyltransferase 3/4